MGWWLLGHDILDVRRCPTCFRIKVTVARSSRCNDDQGSEKNADTNAITRPRLAWLPCLGEKPQFLNGYDRLIQIAAVADRLAAVANRQFLRGLDRLHEN